MSLFLPFHFILSSFLPLLCALVHYIPTYSFRSSVCYVCTQAQVLFLFLCCFPIFIFLFALALPVSVNLCFLLIGLSILIFRCSSFPSTVHAVSLFSHVNNNCKAIKQEVTLKPRITQNTAFPHPTALPPPPFLVLPLLVLFPLLF